MLLYFRMGKLVKVSKETRRRSAKAIGGKGSCWWNLTRLLKDSLKLSPAMAARQFAFLAPNQASECHSLRRDRNEEWRALGLF